MSDGSSPEAPQSQDVVQAPEDTAQPEKTQLELAQSWLGAASKHYDTLYRGIKDRYTVLVDAPHMSGDLDQDQAIIEEYGGLEEEMPPEDWSEEDRMLAEFYLRDSEWFEYTADDLETEEDDEAVRKYAEAEKARQKSIADNKIDPIADQLEALR